MSNINKKKRIIKGSRATTFPPSSPTFLVEDSQKRRSTKNKSHRASKTGIGVVLIILVDGLCSGGRIFSSGGSSYIVKCLEIVYERVLGKMV